MNSLELVRKCWWCNKRLMKVSHAEVTTPDGHTLLVHKACEANTRAQFKHVTAQPQPRYTTESQD